MMYRFGSMEYDLTARTHLMGIVNVTPDSFADGGKWYDTNAAIEHGLALTRAGADFLDVGGESTRPGAVPVSVEEELRRVVPVIRELRKQTNVPISIDTYKAEVAEKALTAGAELVNDITGLHHDARIAKIVADANASLILMHMKGTPQTMQINPVYTNLINDICDSLEGSIETARRENVVQIILDPGIGFGKTIDHNLEILRNLREFQRFGYPILVGPSRKSFLGTLLDLPVNERFEGTAAAVAASIAFGAHIIRVHDVKEMKRIAIVMDAIVHSTEHPVVK